MNCFKKYFSSVSKKYKVKNHIVYYLFIAAFAVLTPLALTGNLKMLTCFFLEQAGYSILMAVSLSLVVGFLGELSLGHAGFISIGAIIGAFAQNKLYPALATSSPILALILTMAIGGIAAALFGFLIGLPALRLKGDYLAIVTLAFCLIVQTIFEQIPAFGGAIGIENNFRYNYKTFFLIILAVDFFSIVAINNFIRSKHGRAVTAIRDNEIAARAMGVNVSFNKVFVFVFSSFFAGIAGVLVASTNYTVAANQFTYNYSIDILVMVVLGGMGSTNGSILAAILVTYLNNKLNGLFSGNLAAIKNIVYALILILIVIYTNAPALKTFKDKYNIRSFYSFVKKKVYKLFTKKEKAFDPATEVEFEADWTKIPTKIDMDALLTTDSVKEKSKRKEDNA